MKRPNERDRLSHFGEDALGEDAIARIAERVAADGPRVVRRARIVRTATRAGSVAIVVLLGAVLWRLNAGIAPPEPERMAQTRPCESWPAPAPDLASGRIDFGPRGTGARSDSAVLTAKELVPCRMVLELAEGRLAIHAEDLGGGELVVQTRLGIARVIGTIFSVEQHGDHFAVEVAEGRVEVVAGAERTLVSAGSQASLSGGRLSSSALADDRRDELIRESEGRRVISAAELEDDPNEPNRPKRARPRAKPEPEASPPIPETPPAIPESADELVRRAAEMKTRDPLGARALYRQAGGMRGGTAEAAWIALARLELAAGEAKAAIRALDERERRFPAGSLNQEAAGVRLDALAQLGDRGAVVDFARQIVAKWPGSQQAKKAQSLLEQQRE